MKDDRTSRIRAAAEPDAAGLDVWLPVLVAIAAAFFLLLSANAQSAPRPIYDAHRFAMTEAERTALEEHAAQLAETAAQLDAVRSRLVAAPVEMRPLPALTSARPQTPRYTPAYTPTHTAMRPVLLSNAAAAEPDSGWLRLAFAVVIAAMLGSALVMLDRTWRRTGPVLPMENAAA